MDIPKLLGDNIAFMMDRTSRDYQVFFDHEMAELNLTRSQWLLLTQLSFVDGSNQKELADLMGIDKSALGRLALKLEEKGWLRRELDDSDGRAYKLFISDKARPLVRGLVDMLLEETESSLRGFSAQETEALRGYMSRIQANIRKAEPSERWMKIKAKVLAGIAELRSLT